MASSIKEFLNDVQKTSKEDIRRKYELQLPGEPSTVKGKIEELIDGLIRKDAFAVWNYIANVEEGGLKEMKDLSVCRKVIEHEERKQKWSFRKGLRDLCGWQNVKTLWPWQCECTVTSDSKNKAKQGTVSQERYAPLPIEQQEQKKENEQMKQEEQEDEQKWLTILSDPLYIGLKWLWSTNPTNSTGNVNDSRKDVIQNTLHDSYLLEQLAENSDLYLCRRDDYLTRASRSEDFAIGVIKQGSSKDLHELMDPEGSGILVHKDNDKNTACENRNYSASLRLLQTAAVKGRKKFVSTSKCQRVLDEIIYQDASWKDRNMAVKFIWAFCIHLPLVVVLSVLYIPYMLVQLVQSCKKSSAGCGKVSMMSCSSCSRCSDSMGSCRKFCCLLKNTFEHPYSKLASQNTWYGVFLFLVLYWSHEQSIRKLVTGLNNVDYVMMAFVSGYLVRQVSESYRQGFRVFYSKWWNVIDFTVIISFVITYATWLIGWAVNDREWKPRQGVFIWSDMVFASASTIAFLHLVHVFQFNSTLGPLQLSLYKMLRDVLRFLLIFFVLYIAFATGLTRIYAFYVSSQKKLRSQNETHYETTHPYQRLQTTLWTLLWLLLGELETDNLKVCDPAFKTTHSFGRIYVAVYILVMVLVALNALIAMMSNTFQNIMENTDKEWRFSKTLKWLEIINMHPGDALPSPLSNIAIIYYLFYLISHWCCSGREERDHFTNVSEQRTSGKAMQGTSPHVCLEMTTKRSSTAVKDITSYKKDYEKARIETMKKLVVRYLNGYLMDEKDKKRAREKKQKRFWNKSSSPMESRSVQTVFTANVLANIQDSMKSLDNQLKALRNELASLTANTSSSMNNEQNDRRS